MENYIQKIASRSGGENEMISGSIITPSESGLSFMDSVDLKANIEEEGSIGDDLPRYPGSASKIQQLFTNPDSGSQNPLPDEVSAEVYSQNRIRYNEPVGDAPLITPIIVERQAEPQKMLIESRQQETNEIIPARVQTPRDAIVSNSYKTVLVPAEKENILTNKAGKDLSINMEHKSEDGYKNNMTILQPEVKNTSVESKMSPWQKMNPPKLVIGRLTVEVVQQKKETEKKKQLVSKPARAIPDKTVMPGSLGKSGFGLGQF